MHRFRKSFRLRYHVGQCINRALLKSGSNKLNTNLLGDFFLLIPRERRKCIELRPNQEGYGGLIADEALQV